MQYKINNDSLMHYGVLGMKWGVRKAEKQKARLQAKRDRAYKMGQTKNAMAAELSKKGTKSRAYGLIRSHEGWDYAEMYSPKDHASIIREEARADLKRAAGYDKLIKSLDPYKMNSQQIKKQAKIGARAVEDSVDTWGGWDTMAENYNRK